MKFIGTLWPAWERAATLFGNIMTRIILSVFYFTIFALFAIPYRLLADALGIKEKKFTDSEQKKLTLDYFKNEF